MGFYLGTIDTQSKFKKAYVAGSRIDSYKADFSYSNNLKSIDTDGDGILDFKELISRRNKYDKTVIKNNTTFNTNIVKSSDVHTFVYEQYNGKFHGGSQRSTFENLPKWKE